MGCNVFRNVTPCSLMDTTWRFEGTSFFRVGNIIPFFFINRWDNATRRSTVTSSDIPTHQSVTLTRHSVNPARMVWWHAACSFSLETSPVFTDAATLIITQIQWWMSVGLCWNDANSSNGRQACPSTILTTTYRSGIEQLRTYIFCHTTAEVKLFFYKENITYFVHRVELQINCKKDSDYLSKQFNG